MCGDDDLNVMPPDTDLLQVDNDLNDNNGDDNDDDLNDNSGIGTMISICCHLLLICCRFIVILGECIVPCKAIAPLYLPYPILSISSSVAPSIFTSSLYIFPTLSSPKPSLYIVLCSANTLLYSPVNISQSLITVYVCGIFLNP